MLNAASGFRLDPTLVDDRHDLVVVGNPTNPTSTLHPSDGLRGLRPPGPGGVLRLDGGTAVVFSRRSTRL